MEEKVEKKSISKYKYTILIIAMFIAGIFFGILFSNMNSKENKGDIKGISEERAKEIALEDAKKDFKKETALDTDIYIELDKENEKDIYEVSFVLSSVEYWYEIKISDGTIASKKSNLITNNSLNSSISNTNSNSLSNDNGITLEEAKGISLKDSDVMESDVTYTQTKQETEKGVPVYEIEFYSKDKKYDYEIKISTGEIISKEVELRNKNVDGNSTISEEDAKNIALKDSGFTSTEVTIKKIELERENTYTAYEIEFYQNDKEYDYEIHTTSGIILKYSWKIK